jgi:mono/diheme cytochrome c family protein
MRMMTAFWLMAGLGAGLAACGDKSDDTGSTDTASDDGSGDDGSGDDGSGDDGSGDDGSGDDGGNTADGPTLFANHCAACHGADGRGGSGPDLADEVPGKSDGDLTDVILNGDGNMPPIAVSGDEAAVIVAHLRTLFPG